MNALQSLNPQPAPTPRLSANPLLENTIMKSKAELQPIIDQIASADSPVGMDAVYVHALILEKLGRIEERLDRLERQAAEAAEKIV